jgi:2',5'-phosphodiesterase
MLWRIADTLRLCGLTLVIFSLSFMDMSKALRTMELSSRIVYRRFSSSSSINIISYNILSSSLSEPSYFHECKPQWLDPRYRVEELQKRLTNAIGKQSIICLQEVSNKVAAQLHPFFARHDYSFITGMYGKKFDGYMGVAIAIPHAKFAVVTADITRIADTKHKIPRNHHQRSGNWASNLLNSLSYNLWHLMKHSPFWKPSIDIWDAVKRRDNHMVAVQLKNTATNDHFVVGTYHMPCMYKEPAVMMAHCALSAQHIHRISNGLPYVLAGDFNVQPESSMYQLLTSGEIDPSVSRPCVSVDTSHSLFCGSFYVAL